MSINLYPSEDQLQTATYQYIQLQVSLGNFDSRVWVHHSPNEGKRSVSFKKKLKSHGTIYGCPDFILMSNFGSWGIELKSHKGILSPSQKAVQADWERKGIPYEIARSLDEVEAILLRWGLIKKASDSCFMGSI